MSNPNENWYSLVAQSRTDHIYALLHHFIPHDWEPGHDLDFVVVRCSQLPLHLQAIPAKHSSKKLLPQQYCFPATDYVLLHNYQLTEYLEAAVGAIIIEDSEARSFIELLFKPAEKQTVITPLTVTDLEPEEVNLIKAYELLQKAEQKELVLQYAEAGERFLDNHPITLDVNTSSTLHQIARQMVGYNIVAMVYAWNNQMANAAAVDAIYIHYPSVWDALETYIQPYLEMLMIKKELDYVQYLFSDKAFRKRFAAHYEAFISLFIDDMYALTHIHEVVGIINRVNNASSDYL